jgi:oxaloacetate decarboxylase alpha subunit
MPNTPQQMLFRGQNILGYRHYADDLVEKFVERAAINGVDVFRVFDAMNDPRNLECAIAAVRKQEKHAQGTLSYTVSPMHNLAGWLEMAARLESMGADSIAIKDMAGLLTPYAAFELVSGLKKTVQIPIHMQCHATTGLSTATYLKSIEAGIDNVDTAISSMSMTYGHSPTESVVAILQGTERDTGLNMVLLEEIAAYFRAVRKKYAAFEGALRGIDSRILVAQVPGGMLTNLEGQLKEQNATDKLDAVLEEIPKVRAELGFIPLVTPTSQIVGTQAVLNVLTGERYSNITKETQAVLKGEYGATPAPVDADLQAKVLAGETAITCRPADLLGPEFDRLQAELEGIAKERPILFGDHLEDDVLTYALFPQVALKFFENRNNPAAFEPVPTAVKGSAKAPDAAGPSVLSGGPETYTVAVAGQTFVVSVTPGGDIAGMTPVAGSMPSMASTPSMLVSFPAPLAGNVFKVLVKAGESVAAGQVVLILEAMKMETEIRATSAGLVSEVLVREGDAVKVGESLMMLS